ncbi:hypothetical protein MAIT1_01730 [Magnetofaba australis IT-1]|uniref:Tetratricopeptide repeat protein n=2 Tax=Magnetofaba TaxID=1472292 RepID=A0A1Y2K129_9PROT|nr:hypothetical protein MAIT1_01730 [Magnetofaba australis IT-1]
MAQMLPEPLQRMLATLQPGSGAPAGREALSGQSGGAKPQPGAQEPPMALDEVAIKLPEKPFHIALSSDAPALDEVAQAQLAIASGRVEAAEARLRKLHAAYPKLEAPLVALADLLLRQERWAELRQLMESDTDMAESSPPLIFAYARALWATGQTSRATLLLAGSERINPSEHPNHYSLLAAIYQRTGRPMRAARLYRTLLSSHPPEGRWWLGLALAEEKRGAQAAARKAYAALLSMPNPTVGGGALQYAQRRLAALDQQDPP